MPPSPAPEPAPLASGGMRLAIVVFLLVLAVSLPRRLIPLGFAGGSADDDWFTLGANLATFGVFGFGEEAVIYRAPGYPAFVALVLELTVDPSTHSAAAVNLLGPSAVLLAQSFLLALCALLLYLWLARRISAGAAFAAAIVFGTNPYSLVFAGLIHYDVLNWALLLAFLLVLELAFERRDRSALPAFFLSGLLLTAGVLVRPVTLLVPLPLLWAFLLRRSGRERFIGYATLLMGFLLALLPWTARNLALSGRVIPVHAQGWTAMFASTSDIQSRNPDLYQWNLVAMGRYMPLYRKITGENEIMMTTYARNVVGLEDAARAAALENLGEQPLVYATNFLTAALSLPSRVNAVLLTAFVRIQTREPFDLRWIYAGQPSNLARGPEALAFQRLHDLLLLAALLGLCVGLRRGDVFLAVPVALFGAIVLAHALSYLDFYYYAVKMPFLIAFGFYGIDLLPRAPRYAMIACLLGFSLALTWSMRFFS